MAIDPAANFANAVQAYNRVAGQGDANATSQTTAPASAPAQSAFGQLVTNAINSAAATGQNSEQAAINAINTQTDMTAVVTAVAEAEVTLQTVMSVRDKVVEAYKEILRMPI